MTPTPPNAPPPVKPTEKEPLKGKVPEGRSIYFAGKKKLKPGDKIPEALEKTLGKKPPKKAP